MRAHVSAAGAKGGKTGKRSDVRAGGFTTKIHAKSDASGDIIAFDLTGGEASERASLRNPARHRTLHPQPRAAIRQGYASKANREAARARHRAGHPAQGQRKRSKTNLNEMLAEARPCIAVQADFVAWLEVGSRSVATCEEWPMVLMSSLLESG